MRNNSVTKRRRKIRTGRIKTHQPQSKRCKKISPQIGGVIFTRNGWKCRCKVVPNDKGVGEYGEADTTQPTRKILDGTNKVLKDQYYSVSSSKRIIIYDESSKGDLPKNLNNHDIITEIRTDENSSAIPVVNIEKIRDFYEIIDSLRSKPVILTISRTHIGGNASHKPRYVRVNLESRPQSPAGVSNVPYRRIIVGGKKTTYRRKKHVTRRKINTKRRKVMVGGVIPDSTDWNSLELAGKLKAIEAVSSIDELQTIRNYIVQLKEKTANDEFQQLRNKVAVRKQVLNDDQGEDDSAKLNLKKNVICKCSKTERNKGNDKKKETPKGELQIVEKGDMP